jgi:cystathionine beta-lyase
VSQPNGHRFDRIDPAELRRRTSIKWRQYGPDVLPLWVAEMDFPLAAPIRRVLHELVDRGDTGYAVGQPHVQAFARFAVRRYGWAFDPGVAWTVPDVMTAVEFAIGAFTEPGDCIAFLTPAYPPFFVSVEATGRSVAAVPMARDADAGWVIDLDELARVLRVGARAVLLCNPHNPTGRQFTRDELAGVAEVADRHAAVVISDEIHAPLVLDHRSRAHVPFATLDAECAQQGVSLHSASKGWNLPGLKAAIMVAGGTAAHDCLASPMLDELSERAGIAGVAAGIAAFDEAQDWLDDTVDYIAGNHRLVQDLLPGALPAARVTRAEATYLCWLDLRDVVALSGTEPAAALLERAGVAMVPGPRFGSAYRGWARLNLGTSRPLVRAAVECIAAAAGGQMADSMAP